jgi:hypothetical protein
MQSKGKVPNQSLLIYVLHIALVRDRADYSRTKSICISCAEQIWFEIEKVPRLRRCRYSEQVCFGGPAYRQAGLPTGRQAGRNSFANSEIPLEILIELFSKKISNGIKSR